MADTDTKSNYRVIKFTSGYAADANVPGVLQPYKGIGTGPGGTDEPSSLDLAGGTCFVFITVNGIPKLPAASEGSGDIYPGSDLTNGDIKCNFALNVDDIMVVQYGYVGYRELPAA
jgi:hypothetical protein